MAYDGDTEAGDEDEDDNGVEGKTIEDMTWHNPYPNPNPIPNTNPLFLDVTRFTSAITVMT